MPQRRAGSVSPRGAWGLALSAFPIALGGQEPAIVTDANVSPTRIGRDDRIYRPGDSLEIERDDEVEQWLHLEYAAEVKGRKSNTGGARARRSNGYPGRECPLAGRSHVPRPRYLPSIAR
jgi:hypothetical protein